jgi:hypothetical protein
MTSKVNLEKAYSELASNHKKLQKQNNELLKKMNELQKKYNNLESAFNIIKKAKKINITKKIKQNLTQNTKSKYCSEPKSDSEVESETKSDFDVDSNITSEPDSEPKKVLDANKFYEKRPLTGYMLFASEKRSEVLKENPKLRVTEIAVKLGEMWKSLSDEEKDSYKNPRSIRDVVSK